MHLVYFDESGNSGNNLNDPQQPIFVLCAMIVDEKNWQALENDLKAVLDKRLPHWRSAKTFEVHATDLRAGRNNFKGLAVAERIAFRDEWMSLAVKHGVRLSFRSVNKKGYSHWLVSTFGAGVAINPHIAAFALLSRCVDNYLQNLPGRPLGMFISDENKQVMADVEKSVALLKVEVGIMRLNQIIEKGFFIDSSKSLPVQLCDLFALSIRKSMERKMKIAAPKKFDDSGIVIAESLLYENKVHDMDVLAWLTKQHAPKFEPSRRS